MAETVFKKEKDLFPPLKKMFKEQGYSVFAEVPVHYRGVDFVAVKDDDHIAVEMKLSFSSDVIRQASYSIGVFNKAYVAFPVAKPFLIHDEHYWELNQKLQQKVDWCSKYGIGILQVMRCGTIFTALEARDCDRRRIFDFQHYRENEEDEAGLPFQKGVSAAARELVGIKEYIKLHPYCDWKEIYANVQNHYANWRSLAGSMGQHRGFSLAEYKKELGITEPVKETMPLPVEEPSPQLAIAI
jgi:hypothetical protein